MNETPGKFDQLSTLISMILDSLSKLASPIVLLTLVSVLIFVAYAISSIKIINQGNEALVERFGRYHRKLSPGLNFIVPLIDSIVLEASTRERVLDLKPVEAITKDNVSLLTDAVLYWRILQLEQTYYAVEDVEAAIGNIVATALRSELGRMELNATFSSRSEINLTLLRQLDDATLTWGVQITRVEVQNITPSKKLLEALELERASESLKRGAITEAEAKQQADLLKIESTINAMRYLAEAMQSQPYAQEALRALMTQDTIEANLKLGESANSKVIFMDPQTLSKISEINSPDRITPFPPIRPSRLERPQESDDAQP